MCHKEQQGVCITQASGLCSYYERAMKSHKMDEESLLWNENYHKKNCQMRQDLVKGVKQSDGMR